jgi:hypothetical protein
MYKNLKRKYHTSVLISDTDSSRIYLTKHVSSTWSRLLSDLSVYRVRHFNDVLCADSLMMIDLFMFTDGTRTLGCHIEERPEMSTGCLVCRTVHHDNGFIFYVLSAVMGAENTVRYFYHAYALRDYSIYLLYTVSSANTAGEQGKGIVVHVPSASEGRKGIFQCLRCWLLSCRVHHLVGFNFLRGCSRFNLSNYSHPKTTVRWDIETRQHRLWRERYNLERPVYRGQYWEKYYFSDAKMFAAVWSFMPAACWRTEWGDENLLADRILWT